MKSDTEQTGRRSPETPRDPRIRRTRRALQHALGSLLHERSFEAIAIKQILARADVARATFYAHFSGKQDLLESAVADAMKAGAPRTAPNAHPLLTFAWPLLEHIAHVRAATPSSGSLQRGFHREAHDTLRRAIRDYVSAEAARGKGGRATAATSLLANQVASTFVVVLEWWLEEAPALSARDAYDRFAHLVEPALHAC